MLRNFNEIKKDKGKSTFAVWLYSFSEFIIFETPLGGFDHPEGSGNQYDYEYYAAGTTTSDAFLFSFIVHL